MNNDIFECESNIETISTGSLSLDEALGIGGLPRGRIIEIFGPESSGKTTIALHVIAEAQKAGGFAVFIDADHDLDPVYAKNIGVDIDDLIISQPDNGEQALDVIEKLLKSSTVDVIVIDSVVSLVPKAEIDGEMGNPDFKLQANLISKVIIKLTGIIKESNTIVIFTNQLRKKLGNGPGNRETTPYGKVLKLYSSIRLDVRKSRTIKKKSQTVGNKIKVKVAKNKLAPPFIEVELNMIYGKGISKEERKIDKK